MKPDTKCIFCSIINNEISAVKIYEDSQFVAFMDKYPINTGHTLVLPKRHHENIFTMDDEDTGRLFSTVSFLAKGIVKSLEAKGLNIGQNNGRAANQIVPHEWNKFVTPDELARHLAASKLAITEESGVVYNPFLDKWGLSADMDVNYMVVAEQM